MKVSELMTHDVCCCGPRTNLAEVTEMLWKGGCGAIAIVDDKKRVIGIVTDRDICIALGTRNCRPSEVAVEDVMSRNVFTCAPDDEMKTALGTMHTRMVQRLPVVSADKTARGMLSLSVVAGHASASGDCSHANVMSIYKRLAEGCAADSARATGGEPTACSSKTTADPALQRASR